jgi:serine/threonine-protein kinase
MSNQPRVQQLVDEVLDSERTPEEVCADCPELLEEVRKRSQEMLRRVEAELDALFPTPQPNQDTDKRTPSNPAAELPRIPGYQVEAVLGRGGMGIVYKARHLRLNRPVALKMLLAGAYAGPEARERFLREAEAVAGLRHANIVQVYDTGDHDGRPYFTMEYVDGGSLARRLLGTPQCVHFAAAWVATLAEAVQVAHHGGIIHRDLKPANILLQRKPELPISNSQTGTADSGIISPATPPDSDYRIADYEPKIADFGLARHFERDSGLTQSGTPVGTPSYMAPEQALGKTQTIGPSVDIYSLGAVLYELLAGRPPFRGETPAETLQLVIHHDPVPPSRLNPKVPRDLETICLKCLEKEPSRRYATAAALADDLRCLGAGRPIKARPVGWAERWWRWCRRKPAAAALIVMALALVGLALAGARWLELRKAEHRAETARQEEAVKAALEKAAALQQEGRWPEARAALEGAQRLLGDSAASDLVERVSRARADADMVARLEEIRLRLSEGGRSQEPAPLRPEELYAAAFRTYGISVLTLEPAEAAARLHDSAIRETLLAFMHDWLYRVPEKNRARLRDVLDRADDDNWRRAFREALLEKDAKKLSELARAPGASAQPPGVVSGLAAAMIGTMYKYEAQEFMRAAQQRHPGDFWINYLLGCFWWEDYPQEAVGYLRAAVAIRPTSDGAYLMLGKALRNAGDSEGAIAAVRRSVALNPGHANAKEPAWARAPGQYRATAAPDPKRTGSRGPSPTILLRLGRWNEARVAWKTALKADPPGYEAWFGYPELCLFLGEVDEYRRARRALLERFGATTDPYAAERISRACLLLPATGDELHKAVAVAARAVARTSGEQGARPYFEFAGGLAVYRQGQYDRAISAMRGDAAIVLRPAPALIIAMALHQKGQANEARKTLTSAILSYDWSADQVRDVHGCILHVLRREAESIFLPRLPAFLDGKYLPRDNDERLAMLGACQFTNRTRAMARLYADAFAASPQLAADQAAAHRYNAARAAARAGCGHGEDAPDLGEAEGKKWRDQAGQWLRADLAARARSLDTDPKAARLGVRAALTRWQKEPDLACVRDPSELNELAADERKEYLAFWAEVAAVLARTQESR